MNVSDAIASENLRADWASASYRRGLRIAVVAACIARIAVLAFAERRPARFDFPDSHRYVQVARHIAAGLGPIDHEQLRSGTDPLYPFVLSVAPLAGFNSEDAILRFGRICNSIFGIASVLLLAGLGRRILGERVGLIAAFILALDPILLFFNGLVLTESLYILLLLASVYSMTRSALRRTGESAASVRAERDCIAWAMLAGICIGAATLTRSTNLFLPIALCPIFLILLTRRPFRSAGLPALGATTGGQAQNGLNLPVAGIPYTNMRNLSAVGTFLVCSVLVLTPTMIRNYGIYGAFVPTRIGGGASLMEALGPWADGAPGMDRIQYPPFPPTADELKRDRICRQAAIDWAAAHPADTVRLALAKLKRTWSIEINASGYTTPVLRAACWLTVAPEFLLTIVGVGLLRRRPDLIALLLAPAVYFSLVHVVFVGSVRYRLPAMPFLFLLAASAIAAFRSGRRVARTG
ncbi:MAG: glycosyltransferase family 39 protein [Phycisphaerae bacterium]|nr:glycosyltransferase family 39 protein [Phycisphaerae bacterium]